MNIVPVHEPGSLVPTHKCEVHVKLAMARIKHQDVSNILLPTKTQG